MVGWHHQLEGQEFEQTPGDSEGQGSLACCSSWGCTKSDTTSQLNNKKDNKWTEHLSRSKTLLIFNWSKLQFDNT